MPYKSDAQRRFFHTDTAKKKGITGKEVDEFDQASKGMKLPEHVKKMAYGGETNPQKETLSSMENNPSAGFARGGEVINPNEKKGMKEEARKDNDYGTLVGLRELMRQHYAGPTESSGPVKMADGGYPTQDAGLEGLPGFDVGASNATIPMNGTPVGAPAIMPQVPVTVQTETAPLTNAPMPIPPQQTPVTPPLGQLATKLQQTPPTNYDFYQNLSAQDRLALAQKLQAQQNSGKMLAAKGIAGLGDAIANSFGRGGANAMQNVTQQGQQQMENQLNAVDVARQQKMQDLQASVAMQENDATSPYSAGMRQFVSSVTGKQVPSGVSAAMLKSAFGDIAKIFDSQMVAATAAGAQGVEAGKELAGQGFWQRMVNSISPNKGEAKLEAVAGKGTNPTPTGARYTLPSGGSYTVNK